MKPRLVTMMYQFIVGAIVAGALVVGVVPSPFSPVIPAALASPVCGASGTPNVIALSNPNMYIDSGVSPALNAFYAGYTIRAGASPESGLRIALTGFSGGVVSLATGQPSSDTLPTIAANGSTSRYFLLKATGSTTTPQTHIITLYRGTTEVCSRSFTFTRVDETIKALANKVDSVSNSTTTSAAIGDVVVVTVLGRTGTLGAGPANDPGVLSYSPTAIDGFPVGAWRLQKTELTIDPTGSIGERTTYVNRLYLSGASGPDRPYTAKYYFEAIGYTSQSASIQPVQYIASGTQVKHTDVGGSISGVLPPPNSQASMSMTKTVSPSLFAPVNSTVTGGTATYTVTVTNTGVGTGSLDTVVDTLPANVTYQSGTAKVAGKLVTPVVSGQTLTFYGPLTVTAGGSLVIEYKTTVPATAGSYTNSVIGTYANTQIDGSADINTSTPVTATVVVQPNYGSVNANDDSVTTSANTAVAISVLLNNTPTGTVADTGDNLTVSITRQPSAGTVTVSNNIVTYTPVTGFGGTDTFDYTITNGQSSDTATVTVAVPLAKFDPYAVGGVKSNATGTLTTDAATGVLANDFCSKATCTVSKISLVGSGTDPTLNIGSITLNTNGSFTYTASRFNPSPGFYVTLNYRLTDANTKTANGVARFYLSDFGPDFKTILYDTTTFIDVSANDYCSPQACSASLNGATQPIGLRGTLAVSGTGINYNPWRGFWGTDTFNYKKGSDTGVVTVLVGPPDAFINTTFGTAVTRTISSTAYITEFGPATTPYEGSFTPPEVRCGNCFYAVTTPPTKGRVSIVSNTGAYTYTPHATATGADTFVVSITDNSSGLVVPTTITIGIGPDAVNDSVDFLLNASPITINALANDNCPATCTVSKTSSPASGTATLTSAANGTFTYSNSSAIGSYTFNYQVASTASPGLTDTATITVNVKGAVDDTAVTTPGIPVTVDVRANDPCDGCSFGTVTQPKIGVVSVNTNGTLTFMPPADFSGVVVFPYTLTQGSATSAANVTVTVFPKATNDAQAVVGGSTTYLDVLANDVCTNCTVISATAPSSGTRTIASDSLSISYVAPASGGPYTFNYTIQNGQGQTSTATVTITIAALPTAVDDVVSTSAGSLVSFKVSNNDTCTNSPCSITVLSDAQHGVVATSANPANDFIYSPFVGFTGTDTFEYTLETNLGLRDTGLVTIKVLPTSQDDRYATGTTQTSDIDVAANDVCYTCALSIITPPTAGTASVLSGKIHYVAPSTPGTYVVRYRFTEGDISPAAITESDLYIVVGNAAPDSIATNYQTAVTNFNVTNNDTCKISNCGVTSVDVSASPTGDSASIVDAGAVDVAVNYTPATGFSGLATFSYVASYASTTATAAVTVLVGPAPKTARTPQDIVLTSTLTGGMTCTTCTYSFVSAPTLIGEFNLQSNGSYSYTPADAWLGIEGAITYRVTDSVSGLYRDGTLTISVEALNAAIKVTKVGVAHLETTGSTTRMDRGDRVAYSYVLTNQGDSTLTDISLVDNKIDSRVIFCPSGNNTYPSLASGASITCTADYYLTQSDVNSGEVGNIAVAKGTPSGSVGGMSIMQSEITTNAVGATSVVQDSASASVRFDRSAVLSITKTFGGVTKQAGPNGNLAVNDVLNYNYTVTNSGNVGLTNVTVIDDKISDDANSIDCPIGGTSNVIASMDPGVTVVCEGTYAMTQTDLNAGLVSNTGTVTGTSPSGMSDPPPASDAITVNLTTLPSATVLKKSTLNNAVVSPSNRSDVGDKISYDFEVTNSGNVTLTNLTVLDDKITDASTAIKCPASGTTNVIASLAPAGVVHCVATYSLTQEDVDLGSVTNTVTVSNSLVTTADKLTTNLNVTRTLTLAKSGAVNNAVVGSTTLTNPGDKITYTYTVTNTGNTTLQSVSVTDNKFANAATDISCGGYGNTIVTMAPGDVRTCTATYYVTQTDIDFGSVTNEATASNGTLSASASYVATLAVSSTLTVAKTGSLNPGSDGRADAGDTISYMYTVTNTGNTTLANVTLVDNKITSPATNVVCVQLSPKNVVVSMAPGEVVTCTATYTIIQADVDAGSVTNTATVNSGATQATGNATVTLTAVPTLSVTKSGVIDNTLVGSSTLSDAGDTISYTYTVTNAGNTTLANVTLVDNKITSPATNVVCVQLSPKNVVVSMAPGAVVTCTASYTIIQADINAGSVSNKATVTSGLTSAETTITKALTTITAMIVDKSASTNFGSNQEPDAGETITYTIRVTNTGNTTLTSVVVSDPLLTGLVNCGSGTNNIASLAPAAYVDCAATYVVTQSNIDAGTIHNVATATSGSTTANDFVDVTLSRSAAMTVDKTSSGATDTDSPANGTVDAGDLLKYQYLVTNTGNVTLSAVTVVDDMIVNDDVNIVCRGSSPKNVIATLLPGGTAICASDYAVTDNDMSFGSVTNEVKVNGSAPSGATAPPEATDSLTLSMSGLPGVSIVKTASLSWGSNGQADADDTITYTYAVTNTGNLALKFTITDDKIANDVSNIDCTTNNVTATLAQGQSESCTAVYTITQVNIDAGGVTNIGTAAGGGVTSSSSATVTFVAVPGLSVVKSGVLVPGDARMDAGDTINYTYVVTNTGNVTISGGTLSDNKIADSAISCVSGMNTFTLAPGAHIDCTASYSVTQANLNSGSISNTATATKGSTIATATLNMPLAQSPSLTVSKSAQLNPVNGRMDAGNTITYSYVVTNTGNITLSSIEVIDNKILDGATNLICAIGSPTNVIASLTPGSHANCAAGYGVSQVDIDTGSVTNTATATSGSVTNTVTISTTITRLASVDIAKSGQINNSVTGLPNLSDVGDTISYSYSVSNTGNTTLTEITVVDDKIANDATSILCGTNGTNNVIATLVPGNSGSCTATYVVNQTDIDFGSVTNTATVTSGSATDSTTLVKTLSRVSRISLEKTFDHAIDTDSPTNGVIDVGDTLEYHYQISNTGNVTLTDVALLDNKIDNPSASISCGVPGNVVSTLAPGATVSCVGLYTVVQRDIDYGSVTNVATATGKSPAPMSDPPLASDFVTAAAAQVPSLQVTKTGVVNTGTDSRSSAGETITYSYAVTNTGSVTISSIEVVDDKIDNDAENVVCVQSSPKNVIASLAPGASATCTAGYLLKGSDLSAGEVTNVVDVAAGSITATNSLTITLVVDPTLVLAVDDIAEIPMGAVAELDVLANDLPKDATIESITAASAGTATVSNGIIEIIPPVTFIGLISFEYTIEVEGRTSSAKISLNVVENAGGLAPELFLDLNANGFLDTGEPGIDGIKFWLRMLSRDRLRVPSEASTTVSAMAVAGSAMGSESFASLFDGECTSNPLGSCDGGRLPLGDFAVGSDFDLVSSALRITVDPDGDGNLATSARSDGREHSKPRFGLIGTSSLRISARVGPNGECSSETSPAPGRVVSISMQSSYSNEGTPAGWSVNMTATTDTDGVVQVAGLPAGSYVLTANGVESDATVAVAATGQSEGSLCFASTTSGNGSLPRTGDSPWIILMAAFGAITVGMYSRRRYRLAK